MYRRTSLLKQLVAAVAALTVCIGGALPALAVRPHVTTGDYHSAVVDSDGKVWMAGYNIGKLNDYSAPVNASANSAFTFTELTGLPPVKAFEGMGNVGVTTALDTDGHLWVFRGVQGWQEEGTTVWRTLDCFHDGCILLKDDSTMWGFGGPNTGSAGVDQHSAVPLPVGSDTWSVVSAGRQHSLGVRSDGTLWTWGRYAPGVDWASTTDPYHVPQQIGGDSNWIDVEAGLTYSLAVKADGSLYFWGNAGVGSYYNTSGLPQLIDAGSWIDLAGGSEGFLAVKGDGSLWGVGALALDSNQDGLLGKEEGNSTLSEIFPPGFSAGPGSVAAANTNLNEVAFIALAADGTVWAWGSNYYPRLGLGYSARQYDPTLIDAGAWDLVAAGSNFTIARKTGGGYYVAGNTENLGIHEQGYFGYGYGGYPYYTSILTEAPLWPEWELLSAGGGFSIAIDLVGNLWHWGNAWTFNGSGYASFGKPTLLADNLNGRWVSAKAGGRTAFAVREDGTLWAIGSNSSGQMGNGDASHASVFTLAQVDTATDWADVHDIGPTLAQKSDGSFWVAGDNSHGEFGNGTTESSDVFVPLAPGYAFTEVHATRYGVLALKGDGTLWGWGNSANNDLLGVYSPTPVTIDAGPWSALSVCYLGVGAIKGGTGPDAGTLWTWGYGDRVGQGSDAPQVTSMAMVGSDTDWVDFASNRGGQHFLVRKADGSLWGWGYNQNGQLGLGIQSPHLSIEQVTASLDTEAPMVTVEPAVTGHAYQVDVTLSATDNLGVSSLLYTIDGSDPSTSGIPYADPITLTDDATVRYHADDIAGNIATGSVIYVVNHPPVLNPAGPHDVRKNSVLTFTMTATDPDGDGLSFAILQQGSLGTALIDPLTGDVTYDAGKKTGADSITVRVTDNGPGALSDDQVVVINVTNTAPPPVCTDSDSDGFAVEGGECGPIDCNDGDDLINPGAAEICDDTADNDCDGLIDDEDLADCGGPITCSGYGDKGSCNADPNCDWQGSPSNGQCVDAAGCTPTSSDETGLCGDGIDNDCDGTSDCDDNECATDPLCQPADCTQIVDETTCTDDPDCRWRKKQQECVNR